MPRSKEMVIGFWIATALLCLQMGFTAYAQLRLPQVAAMFTHLGFPAYFRVELSWAKLFGVVLLLAPVACSGVSRISSGVACKCRLSQARARRMKSQPKAAGKSASQLI